VNSEIEVAAPEVRVKKGVILARRKNYLSTAKKMMSSGVGWGVGMCCVWGRRPTKPIIFFPDRNYSTTVNCELFHRTRPVSCQSMKHI
jgi:hypothetical protein